MMALDGRVWIKLVLISVTVWSIYGEGISDLRLCADEDCSVALSMGRTTLSYNSIHKDILSCKNGQKVIIYSKSAGIRPDLWGVEINGHRGYLNKEFILEEEVFKTKPIIPVATSIKPIKETEYKSSGHEHKETKGKVAVSLEEADQLLSSEQEVFEKETQQLDKSEIAEELSDRIINGGFSHDESVSNVVSHHNSLDGDDFVSSEKQSEQKKNKKTDENGKIQQDHKNLDSKKEKKFNNFYGEADLNIIANKKLSDNQNIEDKNKLSEKHQESGEDSIEDSSILESLPVKEFTSDFLTVQHQEPENKMELAKEQQEEKSEEVDLDPSVVDYEMIEGTKIWLNDNGGSNDEPEPFEGAVPQSPIVEVPPSLVISSYDNALGDKSQQFTEPEVDVNAFRKSFNSHQHNKKTPDLIDRLHEVNLDSDNEREIINSKDTNIELDPTKITETNRPSDISPTLSTLVGNEKEKESEQQNLAKEHSKESNILSNLPDSTSVSEDENDPKESAFIDSEAPDDEFGQPKDEDVVDISELENHATQEKGGLLVWLGFYSNTEENGENSEVDSSLNIAEINSISEELEVDNIAVHPDMHGIPTQKITKPKDHLLLQDSEQYKSPILDTQTGDVASTDSPELDLLDENVESPLAREDLQPSIINVTGHQGDSEPQSQLNSLADHVAKSSHELLGEGLVLGMELDSFINQLSSGNLGFLLIVALTILIIYFLQSIMAKMSKEAPILKAMSKVDRQYRIALTERELIHKELEKVKFKLESVSSRDLSSNGDVVELTSQLDLTKKEYLEEKELLQERVSQLEQELEESTSNGLEMHKMLSELLATQKDTTAFQESVDCLQNMLDGQREKVETLTSDLDVKSRLNEELQKELSISRDRANKLENQIEQMTRSLEDISGSKANAIKQLNEQIILVDELGSSNVQLLSRLNCQESNLARLSAELLEVQNSMSQHVEVLKTRDSELRVAQQCLKQLRLSSEDNEDRLTEEKLKEIFDVIKVKGEAHNLIQELTAMKVKLYEEEEARKSLEVAMESVNSKMVDLAQEHDLAIQEKKEATSKLAVLTQYFQEKESQLTRELESHEGMRMDAEGSANAVERKIQNYELELGSYKMQVEGLKKELEDQEHSLKSQVTSQEQKAHENWLLARAADRKHEEQRQENSQLRSRLTLLQKEKEENQLVGILKPSPKHVTSNGSLSSPGLILDGIDENHSGPPSMGHNDMDSPIPHPPPPHPHLMSRMFPGGPMPPGMLPPPPGIPPHLMSLSGMPLQPPHLQHGMPPLPPFLPVDQPPSFLPGERRMPPAGRMSSPPYRRGSSPTYDHRSYSPSSNHSFYSDRVRRSPDRLHRPSSPEFQQSLSNGRSERMRRSPERMRRSPDRRSPDRMRRSSDRIHRTDLSHRSPEQMHRSPERMQRSPDRYYNRSPEGYVHQRSSFYDDSDYPNDLQRNPSGLKGKKTSTPLGPNER